MSNNISVGDIVKLKDKMNLNKLLDTNYIVIKIDNREDMASCGYDRTYYLKENTIPDYSDIMDNLDNFYDLKVEVKGTTMPLEKLNDVAPFSIQKRTIYTLKRKKKVLKTDWE